MAALGLNRPGGAQTDTPLLSLEPGGAAAAAAAGDTAPAENEKLERGGGTLSRETEKQ